MAAFASITGRASLRALSTVSSATVDVDLASLPASQASRPMSLSAKERAGQAVALGNPALGRGDGKDGPRVSISRRSAMKIFALTSAAAMVAAAAGTVDTLLDAPSAQEQSAPADSWPARHEWFRAMQQDGYIFTHNYGDGKNPDQYGMRRAGTGPDDSEAFIAASWHWNRLSPAAKRLAAARDRQLLGMSVRGGDKVLG